VQLVVLELELLLELSLELLELDEFDEFDEFEELDELELVFEPLLVELCPASVVVPLFFEEDEHAPRPINPVATTKAPSTPTRKKFMKSSVKLSPPNCCGASKP
jgi:hypothetical protein